MIQVFIWNFRGKNVAWGHAAMRCGTSYVSWWPANPGQAPAGVSRAAVAVLGDRAPTALRSVYASTPIRHRRFEDDVRDEQGAPNHSILLDGLEEPAMESWWRAFSLDNGRLAGPMRPWHTTDLNCSTVVALGLRAGGGDRFAAWHHSWNLVWTPDDVRRYAESIRSGLQRAARAER